MMPLSVELLQGRDEARVSSWLPRQPLSRIVASIERFLVISSVPLCALALLWVCVPSLASAQRDLASAAEEHIRDGADAFRRGSFGEAALEWTEAARLYEANNETRKQTRALTKVARALERVGQYRNGIVVLETALTLADEVDDRRQIAAILGRLGNIHAALGDAELGSVYLEQGLGMARDDKNTLLTASLLNDLGNVLVAQSKFTEAIGAYTEAAALAGSVGQEHLAVTALINSARAYVDQGLRAQGTETLDLAYTRIQRLEDGHDKAYGLINIGLGFDSLGTNGVIETRGGEEAVPGPEATQADLRLRSYRAYRAAVTTAETINDARAESYAWGYLGRLYESQGRHQEALTLTRRAILAAQRVTAPESAYRWHWQAGRVLRALGREAEAIAAYQRAAATVQPIRQELLVDTSRRQRPFRETVGRLYFELADLLLTHAGTTSDPEAQDRILVQARDTVEAFKTAELEDYFQDECVQAARQESLEAVSPGTAILYPIILPDRLELLINLPSGLKRVPVPVSEQRLNEEVRALRIGLQTRTSRGYLIHSQRIYEWIIRPVEAELRRLEVGTLVIVPDGSLRTIPMAALHDGEQFLLNQYAIAVTPGMALTDPEPISRETIKMLLVGITEPVLGFEPLPNVASELKGIGKLYASTMFLNDQFAINRVEQELKEEQYTIVHIASHGEVSADAEKTFVLAYDGKLTMDRLSELIGLYRFRETPIELLTLSACETAAGDDRAALGLAGVAVKAGAKSALATLWSVEDEAAALLVQEFYTQLKVPDVSKAEALRRAQLKILEDPSWAHPVFWAPFLIINNWL